MSRTGRTARPRPRGGPPLVPRWRREPTADGSSRSMRGASWLRSRYGVDGMPTMIGLVGRGALLSGELLGALQQLVAIDALGGQGLLPLIDERRDQFCHIVTLLGTHRRIAVAAVVAHQL